MRSAEPNYLTVESLDIAIPSITGVKTSTRYGQSTRRGRKYKELEHTSQSVKREDQTYERGEKREETKTKLRVGDERHTDLRATRRL